MLPNKRTWQDLFVRNATILLRSDFNVPIKNGAVEDDLKIRLGIPTIKLMMEAGARKIVIISHLGRPNGKKDPTLSLRPVAKRLEELLKEEFKNLNFSVCFIDEVVGDKVRHFIHDVMPERGIVMLENLRFEAGEEQNDAAFASALVSATGAQWFLQDGAAVLHRAHASTDALARRLPSALGPLVYREQDALAKVREQIGPSTLAIIGGSKVKDKQPLIESFAQKAGKVFVGGKIAADGYQSNYSNVYVARDFTEDVAGNKLDIGSSSIEMANEMIRQAETVVWNGTLGRTEDPRYAIGSQAVAEALARDPKRIVILGGDTTAFVRQLPSGLLKRMNPTIISGGGASLEFLAGKTLPGLEAIDDIR